MSFGWDLLFRTVEKDIKSNDDILVCFTHFVLISNGFKCIGLGESKTITGNENQTETLPDDWNKDYILRYVYQGRLYIFKATPMDDAIMLNLIRVDERNVSMVQLNTRLVVSRSGLLKDILPENESVRDLIKNQLIDKVIVSKKSKEASSQTPQQETSQRQPVQPNIGPNFNDPLGGVPFMPPAPNFNPPLGSNDLYPFGRGPLPMNPGPMLPGGIGGGGGMIFDPFNAGPRPMPGNLGVPPGSVPPGARFDPFRAPDERHPPNRLRRPDNDEMPPPGYDDMFM